MKTISKGAAMITLAIAAAGLPAVSVSAQERDRDRVQYKEVARDDMPRPVRQEADRQAGDGRDVKYQRQTRDGKTFYSVHYSTKAGNRMEVRLDEDGKVVDGPHRARDQSSSERDSDRDRDRDRDGDRDRSRDDDARPAAAGDDRGVQYHGISTRDVEREVPREVLRTMNQHTKNGEDLFYQRQVRNGQTFYSVHYTSDDNRRMFVRVTEKGELAAGPQESRATERNAANPEYGRDRDSATADRGSRRGSDDDYRAAGSSSASVRREPLSADQLPTEVRRSIEQTTAGGTDHAFIRETRGGEVSYVVEYVVNGQRTSARVNSDGKVLQASPLSGTATAQRQPTNAAQSSAEPQLASAREAAQLGAFAVLSADRVPVPVRSAIEQNAQGGAADLLIQRFAERGQVLYGTHFTDPQGRRMFMAVDESGRVVVEPRKSNAQEGGKGVRFESVGADQLPAEARQAVEQQGGSDHLFLARTGENGKRSFLVQFTAKDGERMELTTNEEGRLTEKPRRAKDHPFTIAERQGERGERRERDRDR